jgi:hypothetical protein
VFVRLDWGVRRQRYYRKAVVVVILRATHWVEWGGIISEVESGRVILSQIYKHKHIKVYGSHVNL